MDKENKKIIKILEQNGWRVDIKRRHPVAYPPNGAGGVPIALSPSDWRAKKNLLSQIKKQGGKPIPGLHR